MPLSNVKPAFIAFAYGPFGCSTKGRHNFPNSKQTACYICDITRTLPWVLRVFRLAPKIHKNSGSVSNSKQLGNYSIVVVVRRKLLFRKCLFNTHRCSRYLKHTFRTVVTTFYQDTDEFLKKIIYISAFSFVKWRIEFKGMQQKYLQ